LFSPNGEWRHNVCLNLLGRRSGAGTFANLEFRPYGNAITLEIPCDFDNRVVTATPEQSVAHTGDVFQVFQLEPLQLSVLV
jgi:hypothetical protein